MSQNLVKCLRCQKVLIQEEKADHVCTPVLKGIIHIDIDYIVESPNEVGEKVFMAKGLDGYLYRLTVKTEQIFTELSPESKQGDEFRRKPREGNSSLRLSINTLYILTGPPVDECLRQRRS